MFKLAVLTFFASSVASVKIEGAKSPYLQRFDTSGDCQISLGEFKDLILWRLNE